MTLTIETGVEYRTRRGDKVCITGPSAFREWPWFGDNGLSYRPDGTQGFNGAPSEGDIVAKWSDWSDPAPEALTGERKSTHGDWMAQSATGVALDLAAQAGTGYAALAPHQRKAVDMILVKVSRIVSGDPSHADHWDDIAGYAFLGKSGHKGD